MNNKRMTLLTKMLEQEKLYKLAQEVGKDQIVDATTADKLADDIFDQLFDDVLNEAGVSGMLDKN